MRSPNSSMSFWHKNEELGLHKRSLDNSTHSKFVGTLAHLGDVVDVNAMSDEIDRKLNAMNLATKRKMGSNQEEHLKLNHHLIAKESMIHA